MSMDRSRALFGQTRRRKKFWSPQTSEVYGLSTEVQFRETAIWSWARRRKVVELRVLERIDEFLAWHTGAKKKLPTVIVRLFNTVGPRQTGQYGMVIQPL